MAAPGLAAVFVVLSIGLAGCSVAHVFGGATAHESFQSEVLGHVPNWATTQGFEDSPHALAGAAVFANAGCTACHTYLGVGARNLGARDLSRIGTRHGVRYFARYVANPARFGNDVMPRFAALGPRRLHDLAVFLAASKGRR